ncbi:hypothetical protein AB0F03_37465 [Streptomyces sp. NPDC028722]|uniref:hypothetical protein n=1 Tax=Streptomyces sp. NPDC028722 TaxID=3155016 RepID=UPI00340D28F2
MATATWYVYDVAALVQAMLTLYERPGPLGEPVDVDAIERAARARICVACDQPIQIGEGFEDIRLPTLWAACIPGYRHTDSCPAIAAQRRGGLQLVP